ncbi:hypothetical protein [Helicobacter mesocricetorum]|uniref:hypothetical protein n=1 Tax=Helicobacter mesocricetorum TaxID=87012 RepID=UPI000CF18938|nr:hypothetical protein [Helicobacter mesocricetorum]
MVSYFNRRRVLVALLLSFAFLIVLGCAKYSPKLQQTTPKIIFFATKDFRFYDTGFIKVSPNQTALEIFNTGHLLLSFLSFKNTICLNQQCYAKDTVIRRYFGDDSLKELDFQLLLQGKEIFLGENKMPLEDGFYQMIKRGNLEIHYKVSKEGIFFEEKKNKFVLRIEGFK